MMIHSQLRFTRLTLVFISTVLVGCSGDDPPQLSQDQVEIIPAIPDGSIDVQPVSQHRLSTPHVSLKPGEIHYFKKSIEQNLGVDPGNPIGRVWERVEFLLSMTVREEVQEGYIVDVVFHSVRYQSERGNQHLQYDSRSQSPVPPEVTPYRGMIDRGFTLHLDRSNHFVEVVGFDRFLKECFAEYPTELQQELMLSMGALSETPDQVINSAIVFLDESFALVPFGDLSEKGETFPVGSHWTRTYTRAHPVPVEQTIEATLQNIFGEGEWAQVVIGGELRPLTPAGASSAAVVQSRVTGGSIAGSCSVSLKTGLPKTCRIQRELLMEMGTGNQPASTIRKTVVTTLESWVPPAVNAE